MRFVDGIGVGGFPVDCFLFPHGGLFVFFPPVFGPWSLVLWSLVLGLWSSVLRCRDLVGRWSWVFGLLYFVVGCGGLVLGIGRWPVACYAVNLTFRAPILDVLYVCIYIYRYILFSCQGSTVITHGSRAHICAYQSMVSIYITCAANFGTHAAHARIYDMVSI